MSHTHSTDELSHGLGVEEVTDHSVTLALEEATLGTAGNDTARVLTKEWGRKRAKEALSARALCWKAPAGWSEQSGSNGGRTHGAGGAEDPRQARARHGPGTQGG